MPKILIVEAEPHITKILKPNLRAADIEAEHAGTTTEAWAKISNDHYDLIILDMSLSDGSEFDLCLRLREAGKQVPIVLLSPRPDQDRGVEELKVRVNKFIRRMVPQLHMIKFGELTIDPAKRVVTIMGEMISLGRKELDILILLARRAGDVVTRESILSTIYENADLYDRTVDSHMSHLRRKLREVAGQSLKITSVYGLGYRLEWKS